MLELLPFIAGRLADEDCLFVFPTELAARSWQRAALEGLEAAALPGERFLSWDTFKNRLFAPAGGGRPVNGLLRAAFARDFLARNADGKFLRTLLPAEHAGNWSGFASFVRSLLPGLPELGRALASAAPAHAPLAADLAVLERAYQAFLAERGLVEPEWAEPAPPPAETKALIFLPELALDFAHFGPALTGSPGIRLVGLAEALPREAAPSFVIRRHQSYGAEFAELFGSLDRLLGRGASPDDILVSVAGLDEYESVIKELGLVFEVPVSARPIRPLSETRGADIFAAIEECAGSEYHAEKVKRLLLDPAYPWRDESGNHALASFGVNRGLLGGRPEAGRRRDEWREALAMLPAGSERAVAERFELLGRSAGGLRAARDFAGLKQAAAAFARDWFEPGRWRPAAHSAWRLASSVLEECVQAEREGLLPSLEPWRFWLALLGERGYVPEAPRGAIAFHQYGDAAGCLPRWHFILNASQAATRRRRDPWRVLGEPVAKTLERAGLRPVDASESYLSAYLHSGREVALSFSGESRGGPCLPPSMLVESGLAARAGRREEDPPDPPVEEARFWAAAGAAPPRRLRAYQRGGLAAMLASGLAAKGPDLTRDPIAGDELRAACAERLGRDGRLHWSNHRLSAYTACPFAFLLEQVLGVKTGACSINFAPALAAGTLYHRVLHDLFAGESLPPLDPASKPDYLARLARVLERGLRGFQLGEASPPRVALAVRAPAMREALEAFIEWYAAERPGHELIALEGELSRDLDDPGLRIVGRIDLAGRDRSGRLYILDYKSGRVPKKAEVTGGQAGMRDFQIPFYLYLLGGENPELAPVGSAGYYSLENRRYTAVVGEPRGWKSADQAGELVAAALDAARRAAERVRRGDFMAAAACAGCELRAVCRVKYSIR